MTIPMTSERFDNRLADFRSATERLREVIDRWHREHDEMLQDAVIKRFEFTFELAWKSARDWMRIWERDIEPNGPRQVLEAAYSRGVVTDANAWSLMLFNRNRTVHIYDQAEVSQIAIWIAKNTLELCDALIDRLARQG